MSLNDDKRELLKLKQGLETESEIIPENKTQKVELHGMAKVVNFFYYYKIHILVIIFFAIIIGFMLWSSITKEAYDIRILTAGSSTEATSSLYFKNEDISVGLETFCPDFDNNNKVHVENYYINLTKTADSDFYYSNQAKLYGETAQGIAQIYIANTELYIEFIGSAKTEDMFVNLKELYPDNPNIVNNCFLQVKNTALADASKWTESCPEDMYLAIRNTYDGLTTSAEQMKENHERALEVLDNIINDNRLNLNADKTGEETK